MTRLAQRDRAARAKMMARYKNKQSGGGGGGISSQNSQDITPASSMISTTSTEDADGNNDHDNDDDDRNDVENRNSANTIAIAPRSPLRRQVPPAKKDAVASNNKNKVSAIPKVPPSPSHSVTSGLEWNDSSDDTTSSKERIPRVPPSPLIAARAKAKILQSSNRFASSSSSGSTTPKKASHSPKKQREDNDSDDDADGSVLSAVPRVPPSPSPSARSLAQSSSSRGFGFESTTGTTKANKASSSASAIPKVPASPSPSVTRKALLSPMRKASPRYLPSDASASLSKEEDDTEEKEQESKAAVIPKVPASPSPSVRRALLSPRLALSSSDLSTTSEDNAETKANKAAAADTKTDARKEAAIPKVPASPSLAARRARLMSPRFSSATITNTHTPKQEKKSNNAIPTVPPSPATAAKRSMPSPRGTTFSSDRPKEDTASSATAIAAPPPSPSTAAPKIPISSQIYSLPSPRSFTVSGATGGGPGTPTAKERALAISDAKKKLAASRIAAAEKGKAAGTMTTAMTRSDKLAKLRKARSRSPVPPSRRAAAAMSSTGAAAPKTPRRGGADPTTNNNISSSSSSNKSKAMAMVNLYEYKKAATTQPSQRDKIMNQLASASKAKIVVGHVGGGNDGGNNGEGGSQPSQLAAIKLQRERFMRMKGAAAAGDGVGSSKPMASTATAVEEPPKQTMIFPEAPTPKSTNQAISSHPMEQAPTQEQKQQQLQLPQNPKTPKTRNTLVNHFKAQHQKVIMASAANGEPEGAGEATDYKTQRQLYMKMRAMQLAGDESTAGTSGYTLQDYGVLSPTTAEEEEDGSNDKYDDALGLGLPSNSEDTTLIGDVDATVCEDDEEEEDGTTIGSSRRSYFKSYSDETTVLEDDLDATTLVDETDDGTGSHASHVKDKQKERRDEEEESALFDGVSYSKSGESSAMVSDPPLQEEYTSTVSEEETIEEENAEVGLTKEEKADKQSGLAKESGSKKVVYPTGDRVASGQVKIDDDILVNNGKDGVDDKAIKDTNLTKGIDELISRSYEAFKEDDDMADKIGDSGFGEPNRFPVDAFEKSSGKDANDDDDWPVDAFSPTSWGGRSGFSSANRWSVGSSAFPPNKAKTTPLKRDVMAVQWGSEDEADVKEEGSNVKSSVKFGADSKDGDSINDEDLVWNASAEFCTTNESKEENQDETAPNKDKESSSTLKPGKRDIQKDPSGSFDWNDIGEKTSNKVAKAHSAIDIETDCSRSTHYEAFGKVLEDDDDSSASSSSTSNREEDANSDAGSDGTIGSATEFDPLSMFGECEDVSPIVVEENALPSLEDKAAAAEETNADSTFSWTSPNFKAGDDSSKSISFPSLNSGNSQLKFSMARPHPQPPAAVPVNNKPVIDSPAGTESLESWWQSRYASTQNSDINSAVQEALMKRHDQTNEKEQADEETGHSDLSPEISALSPDMSEPVNAAGPKGDVLPIPQLCRGEQNNRPKSSTSRAGEDKEQQQTKLPQQQSQPTPQQAPSADGEDDSIFSGLDDDCSSLPSFSKSRHKAKQTPKKYGSVVSADAATPPTRGGNKGNGASGGEMAAIIDKAETDEDIFSGMSMTESQSRNRDQLSTSQFPRLKESNAMKSLMDGCEASTVAEEPAMAPPPPQAPQMKLQRRKGGNGMNGRGRERGHRAALVNKHAPILEEPLVSNQRLFLPERGYGVISASPTAASVTSDITSSVIFGGNEFTRKSSLRRKGLDILETTNEAVLDQELSAGRSSANATDPSKPTGSGLPGLDISNSPSLDELLRDEKEDEHKDVEGVQAGASVTVQPKSQEDFSRAASRGVSLMSPSTDTAPSTHPSTYPNGGLVKNAQQSSAVALQSKTGSNDVEFVAATVSHSSKGSVSDDSNNNTTVSEAVNNARSSFLSQFTCFTSFAFCAPNDASKVVSPLAGMALVEDVDTKSIPAVEPQEEDDSQPEGDLKQELEVTNSNSYTCGSGTLVTKGSRTVRSNNDGSSDDSDEEGSQSDDKDIDSNSDNDEGSSASSDEDDDQYTLDDDDQDSGTYDEGSTIFSEGLSLNPKTWKDLKSKNGLKDTNGRTKSLMGGGGGGSTSSKASSGKVQTAETITARSKAYEKLLLYAYAALSVPPPTDTVEKRDAEGLDDSGDKENMFYPGLLSPRETFMRAESMLKIIARLSDVGMEVLKLNRHKEWQTRFLTVTKEFTRFKKSEDVRYQGIESCPCGLLWLKKLDKPAKAHTMASIDKSGKGGLLFSNIEYVSVTKDNHALSRKQKKGKFKNSITFVLHTINRSGTKREILFRCMSKEDAFALSAGFQAILDRIRHDASGGSSGDGQKKKLPIGTKTTAARTVDLLGVTKTPLASTKPFSSNAIASPIEMDRWEV